jgi:hypothetical protein
MHNKENKPRGGPSLEWVQTAIRRAATAKQAIDLSVWICRAGVDEDHPIRQVGNWIAKAIEQIIGS